MGRGFSARPDAAALSGTLDVPALDVPALDVEPDRRTCVIEPLAVVCEAGRLARSTPWWWRDPPTTGTEANRWRSRPGCSCLEREMAQNGLVRGTGAVAGTSSAFAPAGFALKGPHRG
jgi:hypothetical protein